MYEPEPRTLANFEAQHVEHLSTFDMELILRRLREATNALRHIAETCPDARTADYAGRIADRMENG